MVFVLFGDRLALWGEIDDADLLGVHLVTLDIPLERHHATLVITSGRDDGADGTHDILEGHGLLLGVDDGALNEELVLALGIDGEVLLHGLQHDWMTEVFVSSVRIIGMDATYLRPRQSRRAPPCQSWALHSKAVKREGISPLSAAEKGGEIERADLGSGRLDLESNGLAIIVCDLKRTLYRLGERAWMQEF